MATKPRPKCKKQHAHTTGKLALDRRAGKLAAEEGSDDELLNTTALAEWLGTSTQWIEIARGGDYGPPYIVVTPHMIRYQRGAVKAWLREREFKSTAEYSNRTDGRMKRRRESAEA